MKRYEALLKSINERDFPKIQNQDETLVSIIVLNRNGLQHLQTLIPALLENTKGINYEFILVDNASTDESVDYVQNSIGNSEQKIHLQFIQNKENKSFSTANNQAAKIARGKYLLLLNNDIEPLAGWLNYMLDSAEKIKGIASVGARLVYPYRKPTRFINLLKKKETNYRIQHAGIAFKNESIQFRPYNLGKSRQFDDPQVLESAYKSAVTAACLLVPRDIYWQVDGLDEGYNYGGEDVDFGLKLLDAGYQNYYCADAVLFHHEFGTQSKEKKVEASKRREQNLKYFQSKWFLKIKKFYWTEKIYAKSNLYAETALTIVALEGQAPIHADIQTAIRKLGWKLIVGGIKQVSKAPKNDDFFIAKDSKENLIVGNDVVSVSVENKNWPMKLKEALIRHYLNASIVIKTPVSKWKRAQSWGDYHMATLLKQQLQQLGHEVLIQICPEWDDDAALAYDVVIVFRGVSRYKLKPQQVNIMWNISHPNDVSLDEYEEYDQVFIASELWAKQVANQVSTPVEAMLQCTDVERFYVPSETEKKAYHQQLLFVGNSRDVFRKILKDLLPTDYNLAVYGKNWKKILPKKLVKGEHIANTNLYKYYGSADILLNDHWQDMREKGFVSNRIYDGLACGAFIITDTVESMGEIKEYLQVYNSKEDLKDSIAYYLSNPEARLKKSSKGIDYIKENHTFKQRAQRFSELIKSLISGRGIVAKKYR